ncbi:MAG: hypothetical protein ACOC5T_01010 [Elusimicrobiota bacterium]
MGAFIKNILLAKNIEKRKIYFSIRGSFEYSEGVWFIKNGFFGIHQFLNNPFIRLFRVLDDYTAHKKVYENRCISNMRYIEEKGYRIIYNKKFSSITLYSKHIFLSNEKDLKNMESIFNTMKENSDFNMEIPWYDKG